MLIKMKEKEIKHFEEFLVKAIQSGKKETSGLVTDLEKKMANVIQQEIKQTVNGKIDKVKEHLEKQDVKLQQMDEKIDLLRPVSDIVKFSRLFRKGFLWIAPLGGAILAIYKFLIKDIR